MASSNVRSIDSLEAFHAGLLRLSDDWDKSLQEVRMTVQRAEEYFAQDRPAYWRRQMQLAERELTEAKNELSRKRATVRAQDRPSATEAVKRVQKAQDRVRTCQAKVRDAKSWAIQISQQCDALLGPLADVAQHSEVVLPTAASELRTLIEQLRLYAEKNRTNS